MVDVPTTSDLTDAATGGAKNGLASGLGQSLGRSVLGPGLGTAAGGITAAAMLDGQDRMIVSTLAVESAIRELTAGGMSGGDSGGSTRL
jgi:hypothetical protein